MFYKTNMALIKHGFSLEELKNMPIHEYYAYVKLYNEEQKERQRKQNQSGNQMSQDLE